MKAIAPFIAASEEWLVRRITRYARKHGYIRHRSNPKGEWRNPIAGITAGLIRLIEDESAPPVLPPRGDCLPARTALFGPVEEPDHCPGGGSHEILFSLLKQYRQCYLDLFLESDLPAADREAGLLFVARYFDRLEIAIVSEWELDSRQQRIREVQELTLLHRMSSAMLSTVRLNNLVHLILAALTSGAPPLFERAMLFLINERSAVLQGMLGVTRETDQIRATGEGMDDLQATGWQLSEEEMARQQDSEFSRQVRECRLELNRSSNISSLAVVEKRVIHVPDTGKVKRVDKEIIDRFGVKAFAVAPLMGKERVFGVVVVDNPFSQRPISDDSLRFLQLFINQAGIAIENSMLYNSLEDANRRLREAQEQLIHGERLATIGEMAAGIAHELKGPLVSIGGFSRRLGKKMPPESTEAGYVATIVSEVQRLEKMLGEILSYSKKTTICYSKCTIGEIIEEALAITAPALEMSRISVVREFPGRSIPLYGDCQQLKQVFINLFSNAQEAMKGGGELRVSIAAAKLDGKEGVAVKVADTGGGIPLEAICNIFHSFYTTKPTGTGLGLPIANRIVTNHGGKIQLHNEPGHGAAFTVILPRKG